MAHIISRDNVANIPAEATVQMSTPEGSEESTEEILEKGSDLEDVDDISVVKTEAARVIQRVLVRDICPITLKPIKRPFRIYRQEAMQVFDPHALFEYITTKGEQVCPMTRTPFTRCELLRLQRMTATRLGSLQEISIHYNADLQRNQTIDYLMSELASASTESARIACISDIHSLIDESERVRVLQQMRSMNISERLLTVMIAVHRPPLPTMFDRAVSPSEMQDEGNDHFGHLFRSVMDDEENQDY